MILCDTLIMIVHVSDTIRYTIIYIYIYIYLYIYIYIYFFFLTCPGTMSSLRLYNESARGWSLHEDNVEVSTNSAPHDGQDTERILPTIRVIWYKRVYDQYDNLLLASQPLKKDVNKKSRYRTNRSSDMENTVLGIHHVTNVTTVLSETTVSDRVSRYPQQQTLRMRTVNLSATVRRKR